MGCHCVFQITQDRPARCRHGCTTVNSLLRRSVFSPGAAGKDFLPTD
jgi:hypothetical protein